MLKRKRDILTPEMRERLRANRDGKLSVDQWVSIVTTPVVWLLVLLGLALVVFGPRMLLLTARLWWLGAILITALIVAPLVLRARRYARLPVHFARLYASGMALPLARSTTLYTVGDAPLQFKRRLTPSLRLSDESEYLVYYLEDASERVLLSLAPSDHEDAEQFLPSEQFKLRFNRRTQS
jgi:hypothetical protein